MDEEEEFKREMREIDEQLFKLLLYCYRERIPFDNLVKMLPNFIAFLRIAVGIDDEVWEKLKPLLMAATDKMYKDMMRHLEETKGEKLPKEVKEAIERYLIRGPEYG